MTSTLQSPVPGPEPSDSAPRQTAKPAKRCKTRRSRVGKVARLTNDVRDSICLMMQDGLTSRAIIQKLGPAAQGLNQGHLSEWKRGGFLDWQRENLWQAELKAQQQFALQLLLTNDETKLPHVVLQIAATQVFQALREVIPSNLKGKFDADASDYTRLLNSLARISRSSLVFTKYGHLCEKEKAAELKRRDPNRKLNENECGVLAKAWNDFFLGPDYDPMAHPLHEAQPAAQPNPAPPTPSPDSRPPSLTTQEPPAHPFTTQVAESPQRSINPSIHPSPPPTCNVQPTTCNPSARIRENCPYCFTLLPPRLATGERPTQECHRCHRNVHHPRMNFEACPHCDNLAPDLLPDGQRPHPDCPHCKKPLPPPPPLPDRTP